MGFWMFLGTCLANVSLILWVVVSVSWWCSLKHKFEILIKSNLPYFSLHIMLLLYLRNYCLIQGQRFTPMFSSNSFIVSALVFRLMIHFNFFIWCKAGVQLHPFVWVYPIITEPPTWMEAGNNPYSYSPGEYISFSFFNWIYRFSGFWWQMSMISQLQHFPESSSVPVGSSKLSMGSCYSNTGSIYG